jgi:tRNA threonylcarbamoyladenosine dehydratase
VNYKVLNEFSRTELLLGRAAMEVLAESKVAIFGIGGVGSYAVEGLVRSGIGRFVLVDDDCICLTNINRQIHATSKTIGRLKVDVMKERILEINPDAQVTIFREFYSADTAEKIISGTYDYIIDAIDTITCKVDLIVRAKQMNIPVISCMGAGNKLNPLKFEVADIYSTSICPLAKAVRKELRKRNIDSLKVVYSKEEPMKPFETESSSCNFSCICPKGSTRTCTIRRQIPGSISFVPSVAGLVIAGEVIKDLISAAGSLKNQ